MNKLLFIPAKLFVFLSKAIYLLWNLFKVIAAVNLVHNKLQLFL